MINKSNIADIENLVKSKVIEFIPLLISVLTNIPVDPSSIPASMGKMRYLFFIIYQKIE